MFYADFLGFLGNRGGPIVVEKNLKLDLIHLTAVPPWIKTTKEAQLEIERFEKMIQDQPKLKLVLNQKDLSLAIADGKIGVILGMQNTPDDITGYSISSLEKRGIRIISPCYDKRNELGSGWLNADISLTNEGKAFVKECAKHDIIIDLSHCGHKMARDIIQYAREEVTAIKIVASHTGCYSQYHHFRNLPDDVLKDIAELNGIVGVSTLTFTNDEKDNSINPFIKHLFHAIEVCGKENVCIGSDDLYITRNEEESRKHFEIMSKKLDPLGTQGARYPENPLEIAGPDMLKKLEFNVYYGGYYFPEETTTNIMGKNLLNFFKRALPAK